MKQIAHRVYKHSTRFFPCIRFIQNIFMFNNNIESLVAGDDLNTLRITGDADLYIGEDLDQNISLVDASKHDGAPGVNETNQNIIGNFWELDLKLGNSNDGNIWKDDGNVPTLTLLGSKGDNKIDFGTTNTVSINANPLSGGSFIRNNVPITNLGVAQSP